MQDNDYLKLIELSKRYTTEYIENVNCMPVFPRQESIDNLRAFDEPFPQASYDPLEVIHFLQANGSCGTVANSGGRYFGFVNGGILPIAHAANWLADTWNQNSALYLMSPLSSKLEEVCENWLVELLGLAQGTAAGFVSGSSNATLCALAAARNYIIGNQGYDIYQNGLRNAPPVRIVIGEQAHSSVIKALSILGFGKKEIEIVPADSYGRIQPQYLPKLDDKTILIIQAGNVNGGAFDPINELCGLAQNSGAWVHVDGAFGLWAAASKNHRHLVYGLEKADSYSVDAHKTLNASYDCGIVLCKRREALINAMQATGAYLNYSDKRDGMLYTTEMSRRSRCISLWATLKQLGAAGVERLVDTLCAGAEYFADELKKRGFTIIQPVFFNQFMLKCETPVQTQRLIEQIQSSGTCWCGGSVWKGEPVIRISICSHKTTKADIDESIFAFVDANIL